MTCWWRRSMMGFASFNPSYGLLAGMLACGVGSLESAAAQQPLQGPVPQPIYMTRKGLDAENNRIDRLVHLFGFTCVRNPYNLRPCRIETELVSFLRTLPPTRAEIARELTALGTTCGINEQRLDCIYQRHVENAGWITGSPVPVNIVDEFLRIDLTILGKDGSLFFEAKYDRTSKPRARSAE
jgi:hypothetical protein